MSSEWMKVMLEEILRKKTEAEQARIDEGTADEQRREEPVPPRESGRDRMRE